MVPSRRATRTGFSPMAALYALALPDSDLISVAILYIRIYIPHLYIVDNSLFGVVIHMRI